jgi:hypothetical protein
MRYTFAKLMVNAAISFCALSIPVWRAEAQVKVGSAHTPAHGSAALDVESRSQGILFPIVSLQSVTDQTTVPGPVEGLVIYNEGLAGLKDRGHFVWQGSEWKQIVLSSDVSGSDMQIGERRSSVISVAQADFVFASNGVNKTHMNGKAAANTVVQPWKLFSEAAGSANGFVTFEGLRMDFVSRGFDDATNPAPRLVNTTAGSKVISAFAFSFGANNRNLALSTINANAISNRLDLNDRIRVTNNTRCGLVTVYIMVHDIAANSLRGYVATWMMSWMNDDNGRLRVHGACSVMRTQ